MSLLKKLSAAKDIRDIANLLNYSAKNLAYLLYIIDDSKKYSIYKIPKKNGGFRTIKAPNKKLKRLQKNLSNLLLNCIDDLRHNNKYKDFMSHGFERQKNIITNAAVHKKRRYVFNIDIEDFFGSINFGRVRGFFIHDSQFKLAPNIATIIAQICCHENSLPQGSPCSPVIANLIGHILDKRLLSLAIKNGCNYTRYADDITFSTNRKNFPQEIALKENYNHKWIVGRELSEKIKASGFSENERKTRMQYQRSRQSVTGLLVNEKINIRPEYRKLVRAMVHSLFTKGRFLISEQEGTLNQLHGMLNYIDNIDQYNIISRGLETTNNSQRNKTYRKFLLYKDFYLSDKPVILCEGKTDNIYLKNAIKKLASQQSSYIEDKHINVYDIKLRFYNYTETSTGRILGLSGGTGDFPKFIDSYISGIRQFKLLKINNPVIIVIDNDSGAKSIYSYLRSILNRKISPTEKFIYINKNLYLVPTPIIDDTKESKIEDFFDEKTKNIKINGKKFNTNENANTDLYYGKSIFAKEVINKHNENINFSHFSALISSIEMAINHFYQNNSKA